jgi:hypothetical protein
MKRAMGLVLGVLAFAVVAHADGIPYGSGQYSGGTGEDFGFRAPSIEAWESSYLVKAPGKTALGAVASFRTPDDVASPNFEFFNSDFFSAAKTAENSVEFDSIWFRFHGFDGKGKHLGIVHSDPFRRAIAVAEVPESDTLWLTMAGLVAPGVWKRRSVLPADRTRTPA